MVPTRRRVVRPASAASAVQHSSVSPTRSGPRGARARATRPRWCRSCRRRGRISWWLDATGRRAGGQVETGFLVIHPGALGDVLQAVPALRGLGAAAPAAPITFVGQPRIGSLLVELGAVQQARTFDGFGLEALFVDAPTPYALVETMGGARRIISWFGSREETYCRGLR